MSIFYHVKESVVKKFVLSLAALIGLASAQAMAATTDLSVTGTVTPAACTPTFANGGVVDYGTLAVTDLDHNEFQDHYWLPAKSISFAIECSAPATFALISNDNRRASGDGMGGIFGLGTHQDQKIGGYRIRWLNANVTVDGAQGTTVESMDGGNTWTNAAGGQFEDAESWPWFRSGFSTGAEVRPTSATSVGVVMDIHGFVLKDLPFHDLVKLDGSSTIELVYL
ncbi:DUF1120 domain-containing protein [Pseudomonas vranovensis]|uniref:DUF1120 domain-containing protein n=1 Tax=Pseudomonas vranovensis TaxID=321661 RepID=UPI003D980995